MRLTVLLALALSCSVTAIAAGAADQQPFECSRCEDWNRPQAPYPLGQHSWYVGTAGLASVLIADPAGLVLIDGGLPQSAEHILDNLRGLGFRPDQVRWILSSHPHFDHAGGIAALARLTGAQVVAGRAAVNALQTGLPHAEDPQAGYAPASRFPPIATVQAIDDGGTIELGALRIRAVASSGHAPGGMSWQWRDCADRGECRDLVFLDSLNAVSHPDYQFTAHPEYTATLAASIERLAELPCDAAVAAHPDQLPAPRAEASVCADYAAAARVRLQQRLAAETTR